MVLNNGNVMLTQNEFLLFRFYLTKKNYLKQIFYIYFRLEAEAIIWFYPVRTIFAKTCFQSVSSGFDSQLKRYLQIIHSIIQSPKLTLGRQNYSVIMRFTTKLDDQSCQNQICPFQSICQKSQYLPSTAREKHSFSIKNIFYFTKKFKIFEEFLRNFPGNNQKEQGS